MRWDGGDTTLIIACAIGAPPRILHWGQRLSPNVSAQELDTLGRGYAGPGGADVSLSPSLAMEPGLGLCGPPGVAVHRQGRDWGSLFSISNVEAYQNGAQIRCRDPRTCIRLDYDLALDPQTGVLSLTSTLTNDGGSVLDLAEMATASLPIPSHIDALVGLSGRWAGEFQTHRIMRFQGAYVRENRRGRTSHDSFPGLVLCTDTTGELAGEAYGLQLAWSGNHRLRVDTLMDGRAFASLGALLLPGEIRLAPGQSFVSPTIVAAYSANGFSGLSQAFHAHIRQNVLRASTRERPRPVHYNTWEAVYFNHDIIQLQALADRAADIGVERFVLDDGWFGARRHDRAGLGDWTISHAVYPQGLKPLIDHVTSLGMEMGIWFEPEMVNPDSDLFRAHPDWVLRIDGVDQVPFRHQYVLDIAKPDRKSVV